MVAVVGTATEVGKTWVTARAIEELRRRGVSVCARKPIQSFDADDPQPTDAEVLGLASGEDPASVCPKHRWYPVPMAPPMAAESLGLAVPTITELESELQWPTGSLAIGFVEAVGGVRSPVAIDGDSVDLVRSAGADLVVLVADAGLGAIDSVRKSVDALEHGATIVYINRFDSSHEIHRRNEAWLSERDGFAIATNINGLVRQLVADQPN